MKVPFFDCTYALLKDGRQMVVFSDNDAEKTYTVFSVDELPCVDVESVYMETVPYIQVQRTDTNRTVAFMGCDGRPVFTIYWRDGKRQLITGEDIAKAFTNAGYGNGALAAVDFYANGDDQNYTWNPATLTWESKTPIFNPEVV